MTADDVGVDGHRMDDYRGEMLPREDRKNSHERELTDDILWSECPEELYLRRILREHHQDEETLTDSIMGQSTVAGIVSGNKDKNSSNAGESDGRSWTNFAPIAGSVATAGTMSLESSPSFVESAVSGPRIWDTAKNRSSEPAGNDPGIHISPDRFNPRFLNFNEEESLASTLPERNIPEMVELGMQDRYDGEATEFDATRAGFSTLSGDTALRYYDQPQLDYVRAWMNAEDITYAKPADVTGTTKSSRHQEISSSGHTRNPTKIRRSQGVSSSQSTDPSREGVFSRMIRRLTDDDKVFRRTVVISVLFIVLFVSLSAVAFVRVGAMTQTAPVSNTSPQVSEPTASPTRLSAPAPGGNTSGQSSPSQQTPPAAAPIGQPATSAPTRSPSVPLQEESPTMKPITSVNAPLVADPFRFVADLIVQQSSASTRALGNQLSPQYRALVWSTDDLRGFSTSLSEERILQRWALAVFFFGLGGEAWVNRDGWLTSANECSWFTSTSGESVCDELGRFVRLGLDENNLKGSLPAEIGLLSDSLTEINVGKNQLSGSIPTQVGALTSLLHLSMRQNELVGSIPFELMKLNSLSKFCQQLFPPNEYNLG